MTLGKSLYLSRLVYKIGMLIITTSQGDYEDPFSKYTLVGVIIMAIR